MKRLIQALTAKVLALRYALRPSNASARAYQKHIFLPQEIAMRMQDRLQYISLKPEIIFDASTGNGYSRKILKKQFPQAKIFNFEPNQYWLKQQTFAYANQSVDLIFANFLLTDKNDFTAICQEFKRVLKPNGLLMFTTLGPDTFKEITTVEHFIDLHELGDQLMKLKFSQPVMDMEYLNVIYKNFDNFEKEVNALQWLPITTKQKPSDETKLAVTYEIIYGHAWGSEEIPADEKNAYFAINKLKRK